MIEAKVICDSVSPTGVRLTTMEWTYPRIVHSEVMTHRMLSRNAASSRAIPFAKMTDQLTAEPVRFGQHAPGMQDKGESHDALIGDGYTAKDWWKLARLSATKFSEAMYDAGYAKQVYNRLTEPFQLIKVVVSATEWNNVLWLRDHEAADPTLHTLAKKVRESLDASEPQLLRPGEFHLPYVGTKSLHGQVVYFIDLDSPEEGAVQTFDSAPMYRQCLSLDNAIKVSAARCAAISFRNSDYNLPKCLEVYHRLVGDERKHASAFEHQATPMQPVSCVFEQLAHSDGSYSLGDTLVATINEPLDPFTWEPGVSHVDRNGKLWSGNFAGWIQNRKLIPGENKEG